MKTSSIYSSPWQKARLTFLRSNPLCVMCNQQGRKTAAVVVDHIKPHRMKEAKSPDELKKAQKLFWDKGNWQPLCKQHHDSTKQRQEKRGYVAGCTADGIPIDPNSHWNK